MSEPDRACELLADLLGNGPRHASEILAAAEGANVSKRTMQRAANMLLVTKTRSAFRGGWIWALPEGDEVPTTREDDARATKAPSPDEESGVDQVGAKMLRKVKVEPDRALLDRAEVIAARLRKLEAGRGKAAPIHASDPRLLRWVLASISDPDLREAYELAVFALEQAGSKAPVTVGQLALVIEQGI